MTEDQKEPALAQRDALCRTPAPQDAVPKTRWSHLQNLLREYDMLWASAPEETRKSVLATRSTGDWSRYSN